MQNLAFTDLPFGNLNSRALICKEHYISNLLTLMVASFSCSYFVLYLYPRNITEYVFRMYAKNTPVLDIELYLFSEKETFSNHFTF